MEDMDMTTYTYTIFDADPQSSSGTAWPDHTDIELEADDDSTAADAVRDAMEIEAAGLSSDDYAVGDTLHAIVWDADGVVVATPTYRLTTEDVGDE
jgi:hypothetical protein